MEAERARSKGRINWLVRHVSKADPEHLHVRAYWPGRARDTQASLAQVRENHQCLEHPGGTMDPTSFEVLMVRDLGAKFSGNRTFIGFLEEIVPDFYEQAGQYLRTWQAPAPRLKTESSEEPALAEADEAAE